MPTLVEVLFLFFFSTFFSFAFYYICQESIRFRLEFDSCEAGVPFHTGNIPFYGQRNKSAIESSTTSMVLRPFNWNIKSFVRFYCQYNYYKMLNAHSSVRTAIIIILWTGLRTQYFADSLINIHRWHFFASKSGQTRSEVSNGWKYSKNVHGLVFAVGFRLPAIWLSPIGRSANRGQMDTHI